MSQPDTAPAPSSGWTAIDSTIKRAAGGRARTPTDDVVMFAALSEAADGWWDEQFTRLYRQHGGTDHPRSELHTMGRDRTPHKRDRANAASPNTEFPAVERRRQVD